MHVKGKAGNTGEGAVALKVFVTRIMFSVELRLYYVVRKRFYSTMHRFDTCIYIYNYFMKKKTIKNKILYVLVLLKIKLFFHIFDIFDNIDF